VNSLIQYVIPVARTTHRHSNDSHAELNESTANTELRCLQQTVRLRMRTNILIVQTRHALKVWRNVGLDHFCVGCPP